MTVNEAKEVLAACGIKLPGQPSKAAVYRAVVEQFIKDPVEVEETLQISNATMQQADADGADSQLSEYQDLLDLVEEDTENRGDPDIKAEQQKVKKKRMAKPKAKASQDADGNIMLGPPKKKARGKARAGGGVEARGLALENQFLGNLPRERQKQKHRAREKQKLWKTVPKKK